MIIYTIINQKGGVGKSTTAAALGAGFILKGKKVLFIDLDPQGNLSYSLNADASGMSGKSSIDVLMRACTAAEAVQSASGYDIIASTPALAGADTVLLETGKESRLKEALEPLSSAYDYAIIDTPPALGVLTINALTAAQYAIVPAQADIFSLQGISQLYRTFEAVQKYTNKSLKISGILLTRYSNRAIISREIAAILDSTAAQLHTKLFDTKIRECTAIKEAQAERKSIFEYAPKSNAALDYAALTAEIMGGV